MITAGIDKVQKKVYICCKALKNRARIQKSAFKYQKAKTTYSQNV